MLVDQIKDSGGNLVAIICDNDRVNQTSNEKISMYFTLDN